MFVYFDRDEAWVRWWLFSSLKNTELESQNIKYEKQLYGYIMKQRLDDLVIKEGWNEDQFRNINNTVSKSKVSSLRKDIEREFPFIHFHFSEWKSKEKHEEESPWIRWTKSIGHHPIKRVELSIGGVVWDSINYPTNAFFYDDLLNDTITLERNFHGDFLFIWHELSKGETVQHVQQQKKWNNGDYNDYIKARILTKRAYFAAITKQQGMRRNLKKIPSRIKNDIIKDVFVDFVKWLGPTYHRMCISAEKEFQVQQRWEKRAVVTDCIIDNFKYRWNQKRIKNRRSRASKKILIPKDPPKKDNRRHNSEKTKFSKGHR